MNHRIFQIQRNIRVFQLNIDPQRDNVGWKLVLDAIRFILAKYEPVAKHADQFYCISFLEQDGWGTILQHLRVPS